MLYKLLSSYRSVSRYPGKQRRTHNGETCFSKGGNDNIDAYAGVTAEKNIGNNRASQ